MYEVCVCVCEVCMCEVYLCKFAIVTQLNMEGGGYEVRVGRVRL